MGMARLVYWSIDFEPAFARRATAWQAAEFREFRGVPGTQYIIPFWSTRAKPTRAVAKKIQQKPRPKGRRIAMVAGSR